ncbi:MAG: hypothetical protein HY270_14600 [Deltaproteobacteria bacterium]|nr:hypothetical protein [Deltaproteobacteria bacterium]
MLRHSYLGVRFIMLTTASALLLVPATYSAASSTSCVGDCGGHGSVAVDDLITMVRIALGQAAISSCAAGDADGDGMIRIDEIIRAVGNALGSCPVDVLALHARVRFDQTREPINQELVGSDTPSPLPQVNQLVRAAIGPLRMRIDVGFEDNDCPDGSVHGPLYDSASNTFNHCRLDERLALAQSAGATPQLIIDYTPLALVAPACAATNGNGTGAQHCPPADSTKYGDLVEAMIVHTYSRYGVTDFEVWNEPDGFFFAGSLRNYLDLYSVCNDRLLRAEQQLALPSGTLHLGGPASFVPHQSWVTALLNVAVKNPALRVDFISWHRYANNPFGQQPDPLLHAGTYAEDTEAVRHWIAPYLSQRADLHPLLWIDEWNVNAFYDGRMDTAYAAACSTAALHAMQDSRLDRAARFFTWDTAPAGNGAGGNWGWFTNDGQVRPAFFSAKLWHEMAATRVAVELLDSDSQQRDQTSQTRYGQNLVAAIDSSTQRATILLYNFVAYDPAVAAPPYCDGSRAVSATLDLDGLGNGAYRVVQQRVDCTTAIQPIDSAAIATSASSLTVANHSAQLDIQAPPDSIILVTLVPATGQTTVKAIKTAD